MSHKVMDKTRDIPEELQEEVESSLEYMRIIVGGLCTSDDDKDDEECEQYIPTGATCDPLETVKCLSTNEFSAAVLVAKRDNMFAGVCQ